MMQGWSAAPSSRPQPYSVACAEGHRLQGQRTEGYQALRCPTCGEGIFVLPRSPLPEPPEPASPVRSRIAEVVEAYPEDEPLVLSDPPEAASRPELAEIEIPEAEIEWVDEIPPETEAKPPVKPTTPASKPRPKPTKAGPQPSVAAQPARPVPTPIPTKPAIADEPTPTLLEWASAHRNALLVAAVLVLVVGAVGMRLRRQRLEELPQIAEKGLIEGLRDLDAGEFHAAKKLLSEAADAVNTLGAGYEGADAIRQGALEAAIFADLAPAGMDEILEEAATGDPKRWPSKFASMYKGRSVILDPAIAEVPDPANPGSSYKVNYPIYFGRGPKPEGRGRIDLTGFRLFELAQPKVDEQKPFGARYKSVELDPATSLWVITFEPDSGVFITHTRALEAINWPTSGPAEEATP
jgi:hypothetical protein